VRAQRWASISVLLLACKERRNEDPARTAAPSQTRTAATPTASPTPPPPVPATTTEPTPAASTALPATADASAATCRVLRGPIELPLRVPASLAIRGDTLEAVMNEDGHPRVASLSAGPLPLGPVPAGRETADGDPRAGVGLAVPCAMAQERIFCPDRSGAVHRTTRGQDDDHVVASSRPASRIAAATIGGAHVALSYLASRQTSEGWVSEAWLAVDDDPPLRVSEDGSGATSLALAERGPALLALMVDARTALTAMHARSVGYDRSVRLGEDAVVFVGGPGDRRTRAALAVPPAGPAWSLLPIAKDVGSFGLAIVRIDEPPRVDEPAVWAMYPNGLDPAPVAAVWVGGRSPVTWVARVRPRAAEPTSPRVLELAQIAPDGSLSQRDLVPTTGNPTDVALALDPFGALWLAWVDGGGSWLERLACR
jgi:hypothetical protein